MSIDEEKLPMREVSFPCPSCKARLTVDRRAFAPPPAASAPTATGEPAALPPDEPMDDDLRAKALIVGTETPVLQKAAWSLGYQPLHFPTVEAARDFFVQEHPAVVFLSPSQLTQPPLEELQPILSVSPADRRKGFFILVAEQLKTFDGTAAFLYGVNLVVASRDLGAIRRIYNEAEAHHQKMYQTFRAVTERLGA
jgi:hypothetical protein